MRKVTITTELPGHSEPAPGQPAKRFKSNPCAETLEPCSTFKRDLIATLTNFGGNVGLMIPSAAARANSFIPGSKVRVIILNGELRIRPVAAPRLYDLESLDDYKERVAKEESDFPERWERD